MKDEVVYILVALFVWIVVPIMAAWILVFVLKVGGLIP